MHRVIPFVVSLGLLLAPLAWGAEQAPVIQFKRGEHRVGSATATESVVNLRLALELLAKDMDAPLSVSLAMKTAQGYTATVLAAKGNVIHKVRMAFDDVVEEVQEKGVPQRKVSPLSGKVFVAELRKGTLTVTDPAGKPVPQGVLDEVKKHLPELGKPDAMEAAYPAKPLAVGAVLEGFTDALAQKMVEDPGENNTRITGTRARLVEIRQEPRGAVGVFDVTMTMTREDSGAPIVMTIPLKGQMSVLAQGMQVLALTLSGPVKVSLTEDAVSHGFQGKGDGEMQLRMGTRAVDTSR
ncbi:hypothetical protein [Comamonas sp. JC664]|uniref:hypothetical protein n=1 Tax=Comamonas sp. JC664 TaxID=2801917 RepID=UPI00174A8C45|nr:hypothetical protein [Comamonas sp. JC664]MBL0692313.1 hypothetical protein [Comamonas sp. JC664]GHG98481.1 hypothetical protein GCM10012319_64240 [Comamonas sp. KCTC 72670]